jgi:hypothetical protein
LKLADFEQILPVILAPLPENQLKTDYFMHNYVLLHDEYGLIIGGIPYRGRDQEFGLHDHQL